MGCTSSGFVPQGLLISYMSFFSLGGWVYKLKVFVEADEHQYTSIAVRAVQDHYRRPPVVLHGYDPPNYRGAQKAPTKGDCPLEWGV